jgi:hypothetical protein
MAKKQALTGVYFYTAPLFKKTIYDNYKTSYPTNPNVYYEIP